jgi:hypothetical protein
MPVRYVFVGNSGGDIEHDDTALPLNIITISQATKFLLTGGIPHVESEVTEIGVEFERMDFNTKSGCRGESNELAIFIRWLRSTRGSKLRHMMSSALLAGKPPTVYGALVQSLG